MIDSKEAIKAKDLMIGNWVSNGDFNYIVDAGSLYDAATLEYYPIEGISITPELLSKIEGFKEYQKDCWRLKINADYNIDYSLYENNKWELTIDCDEVSIPLWVGIKYLHQLQNFLKLLSGKELIIKL